MPKDETPICRLCKTRPASQIKSHIFSQFFLRSNLNKPGVKGRDSGIGYGISGAGGVTAHVEQNVPQSHFEETFGDDLTDEQILDLQMAIYSKDYFLCKNCEQRLQVVEDYFNNNVYHKSSSGTAIEIIQEVEISKPGHDNRIIRLFFYSLLWRASAAKFNGLQFPDAIESKFRDLLDTTLGNSLAETQANAIAQNDEIVSYPLIIATVPAFTNPTANMVFIETCVQPYYFEINEYIVWYFPNPPLYQVVCNLFGLEKYAHKDLINYQEGLGDFKIVLVPEIDWMQKIYIRIQKKGDEFMEAVAKEYFKRFVSNKRRTATEREIKEFEKELKSEDVPIGIRYDPKRIDKVIEKHTTK